VSPPRVALRDITKRFGDLVANDRVSLDVRPGEIHALLGENGAGKTTLMRILYGLALPDSGTIEVDGASVRIGSPRDAISSGIGMVTQHFTLVGPMTVAENLSLGRVRGARLDRAAMRQRVLDAVAATELPIDPDARVADLSVGQQQRVEILKALSRDCRVLIMDEPTAVLVPQEVEALLATLRRLAGSGLSIVFISHKLPEVRAISDRVSVLRRGRLVGTAPGDTDARELARMMVGRPTFGVSRGADAAPAHAVAPVLRLEGLSADGPNGLPALRDVTLEVRPGEVLGVAGVSGNGQTELVDVLAGMRAPTAGRIIVGERDIAGAGPVDVMAAGIGRIPEDRRASLVLDLPVALNLILERIGDFGTARGLDRRRVEAHARTLIERYAIKAGPWDPVRTLSGGNIQKVLVAREQAFDPRLIIYNKPTHGLDVKTASFVRTLIREQAEQGISVIVISTELDELVAVCDRIAVMSSGRLTGIVENREGARARIGELMLV
jgi:simple sugar transport system ATP-binding protein